MNHEDSQMMKVLETIADRMIDMHLATQRGFAEQANALASVQRKLDALMAVKAGEQLSLLAIVTAPEAVVPNEDEAMPVLASCTQCDTKAYTEAGIEDFFGWRKMEDGKTIRQSWCRECRSSGKHKTEPVVEPVIVQDEPSPRKKQRLPDHIRVLGQQFRDLHQQADVKAEERTMVLAASKGRETKESVALLVEEQDLRTEARKFQQQYDNERRPFGNSRKTNGDK